jgi:inner membrane protein YidH
VGSEPPTRPRQPGTYDWAPTGPPSVRDYLANERTLLSWIRTALTVIGLGFVVDRLAAPGQSGDLETYVGIGMILFGAFLAVAGGYSYLKSRRELETGTFRPAVWLHLTLVAIVVVGALVVALFLLLR